MSFTLVEPRALQSMGSLKMGVISISGPNPYTNPGGNVIFTPDKLGLSSIMLVIFQAPITGHIPEYDPATGKVKFYWSGTASAALNEVTNSTNLSAVALRALVIGT